MVPKCPNAQRCKHRFEKTIWWMTVHCPPREPNELTTGRAFAEELTKAFQEQLELIKSRKFGEWATASHGHRWLAMRVKSCDSTVLTGQRMAIYLTVDHCIQQRHSFRGVGRATHFPFSCNQTCLVISFQHQHAHPCQAQVCAKKSAAWTRTA